MGEPRIIAGNEGDERYYQRAFNSGWVWELQHRPRRRIFDCFMRTMQPEPRDLILDLGATNLSEPLENVFEYYYPLKDRIVAAGTEDCRFLEQRYAGLRFVQVKPGERLPFDDNTFDIGFSNATIEHVGSRKRQALFLKELTRVSRRVFLSTPNRWFPMELHTRLPLLHWFPAPLFRAAIRKIGFGFYAQEANLNLLSAGDLLRLVPGNCRVAALKRNYWFGFPSNLLLILRKEATR